MLGKENLLNGLSDYENREEDYHEVNRTNFKSADYRESARTLQSPRKETLKVPETVVIPGVVEEVRKHHRPVSSSSDLYSGFSKYSKTKE
jgi:DNA polymerase/3'-5' exonuclease PolX